MNDHPCSECPFLDFGHKYPVRDDRDPWRRMPACFDAARRVFGPGMFNHQSKLRLRAEKLLGHYCRVQREKYGPCTRRRSLICQQIVADALNTAGRQAPDGPARIAYATQGLRRAVNDEATSERMKATVVKADLGVLKMPPITFREVPAA